MPTAPVTLFSVLSVLILTTSDGSRVLAKYYSPPHSHLSNPPSTTPGGGAGAPAPTAQNPYPTPALQKTFEKGLHAKTTKGAGAAGGGGGDIIMYDGKVVVYKAESDVTIYVVGGDRENEMLLWHVCLAIRDALGVLLKNTTDRRTLLENYDLLTLMLDEILDDGIVLETDPVAIAARVSRAPAAEMVGGVGGMRNLDLSEQGLLNAWEFGKSQLRERLRQGL